MTKRRKGHKNILGRHRLMLDLSVSNRINISCYNNLLAFSYYHRIKDKKLIFIPVFFSVPWVGEKSVVLNLKLSLDDAVADTSVEESFDFEPSKRANLFSTSANVDFRYINSSPCSSTFFSNSATLPAILRSSDSSISSKFKMCIKVMVQRG